MLQLSNENYYSQEANAEYFSVSQVKDFMTCEAYALAKIRGEWTEEPTEPMLIGSYVDSYFEGTLDKFKELYNDKIFNKKGELYAPFKLAEKLIKRIEQDELFTICLSGDKQVIMTGEIDGAPFKIKMDSYIKDQAIVDLKVVKKIRDIFYKKSGRTTFIEERKYDLQLAVYQEIVRQNTGQVLDTVIAAIDKQEIPDIDCILIPNDQLNFQLTRLKEILPRLIAVKSGKEQPLYCGKCDYCRSIKKLERLILPDELLC